MVALLYLSAAEISRRKDVDDMLDRMNEFMSSGPRFSLPYGMMVCEHLRRVQIHTKSPESIDCDGIRISIMTGHKPAEPGN